MISKDLLYALQTRSKQLIRALDDFAAQVKNHSVDERWTIIGETIRLVMELSPTQAKYSHLVKSVNYAWMAAADQSQEDANRLYEAVVAKLEQTVWTRSDEAQVAYQLINVFHEHHFHGQKKFLSEALRQHSHRLLGVIRSLADHSTQCLFAIPIKPHPGIGADAIEMLLEIYFYHVGLMNANDLRGEAATLLLPLVQANPGIGNNLTLSLLQYHPERALVASRLIERYLALDGIENRGGMFLWMMLELLDNDGDSFLYDDLDKITAQLETLSKPWSGEQFDTFARYAFFYRLKTDEDRRLILTKSKKAMRLAKMIADSGRTGTHIDALRALCLSLGPPKPKAPPTKDDVHQFKDLNFKLLVIQELMYAQKKLLPRFDVREFARLYTEREIMVESDGYAVIPEALAYFQALPIPDSLLEQVEDMEFDGGLEIYRHIYPHWDGECETFDVASAEDVKLLPNLKRLAGMPEAFVKKYAAELANKSIRVSGLL
ncbi:MAG TPA: hypothetical protein VF472_10620 [Burkholderiaceae bacterium]